MIDGKPYITLVKEYFHFLVTEFGFEIVQQNISGNAFYAVQFKNKDVAVGISYENIADYFSVTVILLHNGQLPRYDDETRVLNLAKLNPLIFNKLSQDEIELNSNYFKAFDVSSELQRKILKAAKEIRLMCLKDVLAHYNEKNVGL